MKKDIVLITGDLTSGGFGTQDERAEVRALGERIGKALEHGGAGDYDGVEFGAGTFEVILVGADAGKIVTLILPLVQAAAPLSLKTIRKVLPGGQTVVLGIDGSTRARGGSMSQTEQSWTIGDIFTVPMPDHRFAYGQVVGMEPDVLRSVSVALFDVRSTRSGTLPAFSFEQVISCLFVTSDLLNNGGWAIVGNQPSVVPVTHLPYESTRSSGWVGAKVVGSRNITNFLEAFHLLRPWNEFADPQYFDKLLISGSKRPENVIIR